jgi:hypothetical protein
MVLVLPRQSSTTVGSTAVGLTPVGSMTVGSTVGEREVAGVAGNQVAGAPPARDEVLALLRNGSGQRPRFDPGLAGGLRAWLEDAASELVAARGDDAPPLYLGPRLLWGSSVGSQVGLEPLAQSPAEGRFAVGQFAVGQFASDQSAPDPFPAAWVRSCLVRALFRQLVTTGRVGDPLTDALDALRVDPDRIDMLQHIEADSDEARAALSASLAAHVAHLVDLTPRFAAGWLPRTHDRVAIPLAGGRVVLCGVFDLLVGAPVPGQATLCALGLTTGGRWAQARTALHYLALLETLRSGTPPFRLALLHSAVGRYGVEDVIEEHLRAIVSHVAVRLSATGMFDG